MRFETTLHVHPIACVGHGICRELFPDWIRLDDWGYPIIREEAIPPELLSEARWAIANCPALALRLQTVPTAKRGQGDR